MKKTHIASAITFSLTSLVATNAIAFDLGSNLTITNMVFGNTYAASGSINNDGTFGTFQSIDNFFYQPWTATQETLIITNSNGVTWTGSTLESAGGSWDFSTDIANMGNDQIAVGSLFNWNGNNSIAVLAVFNCVTIGPECVGTDLDGTGTKFGGMQNGPFPGSIPYFNGEIAAIPVPAAIWLLGSGLIGLIGIARRRN